MIILIYKDTIQRRYFKSSKIINVKNFPQSESQDFILWLKYFDIAMILWSYLFNKKLEEK